MLNKHPPLVESRLPRPAGTLLLESRIGEQIDVKGELL
jgi:hypothetical protein